MLAPKALATVFCYPKGKKENLKNVGKDREGVLENVNHSPKSCEGKFIRTCGINEDCFWKNVIQTRFA